MPSDPPVRRIVWGFGQQAEVTMAGNIYFAFHGEAVFPKVKPTHYIQYKGEIMNMVVAANRVVLDGSL